jgi:squalene-hopene/tetraprenyl-beta-curcumene cyclase
MIRAICDSGGAKDDPRLHRAIQWTRRRQNFGHQGDWKVYNPRLAAGGFSFEYFNTWYPDTDDTAAAMMALLHQDAEGSIESASIDRAAMWLCGMQSQDGGWGAFDLNNDRLWLNRIPFSDMNALCDPSTADVTGHVLEAFGLIFEVANRGSFVVGSLDQVVTASERAIQYLAREQERNGAWYGRWGANYIYGTSNVLCGLAYFAEEDEQVQGMMTSAAGWLISVQNSDGGWGEGLDTYRQSHLAGRGLSTPSQTAWAIMGLLTVCSPDVPAIRAGVKYLLNAQSDRRPENKGASWLEERYTGVGFPNFFYLGYTLYRHYFPMMALGRYVDAMATKQRDGSK